MNVGVGRVLLFGPAVQESVVKRIIAVAFVGLSSVLHAQAPPTPARQPGPGP